MSAVIPNEANGVWRSQKREKSIHIYISDVEGEAAALVGASVSGFPITVNVAPVTAWIDPDDVSAAAAAVIQVDADTPASIKRFQKLASTVEAPLIAAVYEPPLALVRTLIRSGAQDVVPLPLDIQEIAAALEPVRVGLTQPIDPSVSSPAKLVSAIKSVGGVGATALISQLAVRFAESEAKAGREVCLLDLDVQFGDAAFQLGLKPKLSLAELLDAGSRLDGDLLRAVTTVHSSGLKVIAPPPDMIPLEGLSSDHLIAIVDQATREFGTVFIELPTNWTNWSLSLLARSDLILLVAELTVTSLHRARRQLDLIDSQDLGALDVRVVVNRFEKSALRMIRPADVRQALGREFEHTIANDYPLMRSAIDRGIPITQVKRKSMLARDIATLDSAVAAALGLERS